MPIEFWRTLAVLVVLGAILLCLGGLAFRKPVEDLSLGSWFNLQPAKRLPEELVGLRVLFAYVLWLATPPAGWDFQSAQPHPNGLAHFIDFTFLDAPGVWPVIHYVVLGLIVLYACGLALPVVLPLILAEQLCVFTLDNSQGSIGHSVQLVTMIVMAQTVAFTLWPLWKRLTRLTTTLTAADMAVSFTSQTIAAAYVVCGLSKLVNSKGAWLADVPNLAVQLHKTAQSDYYNTLTNNIAPLQQFMLNLLIDSPGLARIAFGSGLFLELGAILALLGRRWELALGIAIIAMHKVISEAMALSFPFHIWVLFVFWVNVPFWIGWTVRRILLARPRETTSESPIETPPTTGILHGK